MALTGALGCTKVRKGWKGEEFPQKDFKLNVQLTDQKKKKKNLWPWTVFSAVDVVFHRHTSTRNLGGDWPWLLQTKLNLTQRRPEGGLYFRSVAAWVGWIDWLHHFTGQLLVRMFDFSESKLQCGWMSSWISQTSRVGVGTGQAELASNPHAYPFPVATDAQHRGGEHIIETSHWSHVCIVIYLYSAIPIFCWV